MSGGQARWGNHPYSARKLAAPCDCPVKTGFRAEKRRYMPKLKNCPYCHTIYRYRDVVSMKGKIQECYHCRKKFIVKKSFRAIPVLIACIVLIAFNLLVFHTSKDIGKSTFIIMVIINASVILLSILISPLFVRFRKPDRQQMKK